MPFYSISFGLSVEKEKKLRGSSVATYIKIMKLPREPCLRVFLTQKKKRCEMMTDKETDNNSNIERITIKPVSRNETIRLNHAIMVAGFPGPGASWLD